MPVLHILLYRGFIIATILFAWELGDGYGHLAPHRQLLAQLATRGHIIHVATRNLLRAGNVFSGLPIRYWQAPLATFRPEKLFQPTVTLAHILFNVGFASVADVALRITAWRNVYAASRPDVLIADYSPTALLAARGNPVRTISTGTGFCVPPNRNPLPAFAILPNACSPQQLANDEGRVVANINEALKSHGMPLINSVADVFHAMPNAWVETVPELDHYPERGLAQYWGLSPEKPGKPAVWPEGTRRRMFAYLKPFPALDPLLELLNKLELPSIIACDGLSAELRARRASPTMLFAPPNVDLGQMSRECHMAITNGNHTTTARFLLAGKPVMTVPLHLEQELVAHAVRSHELGVSVRRTEPRDVYAKLAELLNTPRYATNAAAFAAKHAGRYENRLERMVEAVEHLASAARDGI